MRKVIIEWCSLNSATALSTSSIIGVELLDDASGILNDLGIAVLNLLGEGVNDVADAHLFELLPALLVNTEVSNRKQSNPSR